MLDWLIIGFCQIDEITPSTIIKQKSVIQYLIIVIKMLIIIFLKYLTFFIEMANAVN